MPPIWLALYHPSASYAETGTTTHGSGSLDPWQPLNEAERFLSVPLCHYGIEPRWTQVHSKAAEKRATKTIAKATQKEKKEIDRQRYHLKAKGFDSQPEAQAALAEMASL